VRRPRDAAYQPAFDFYVVLDFEATCSDDRSEVPPHKQEIIELPSVLVDARGPSPKVVSEVQVYVRPMVLPKLTKFCTELTGITQEIVDAGVVFGSAFQKHQAWLRQQHLDPSAPANFAVVTCGDWDLKSMLPRNVQLWARTTGEQLATPACYKRWINIKQSFSDLYQTRASGMPSMLSALNLKLEGKHHSGIDDCRNIARILCCLLQVSEREESSSTGSQAVTASHSLRACHRRDDCLHMRCGICWVDCVVFLFVAEEAGGGLPASRITVSQRFCS
jgi:inhibitor of KinA sporulation pathway (predicted exonuclease)